MVHAVSSSTIRFQLIKFPVSTFPLQHATIYLQSTHSRRGPRRKLRRWVPPRDSARIPSWRTKSLLPHAPESSASPKRAKKYFDWLPTWLTQLLSPDGWDSRRDSSTAFDMSLPCPWWGLRALMDGGRAPNRCGRCTFRALKWVDN